MCIPKTDTVLISLTSVKWGRGHAAASDLTSDQSIKTLDSMHHVSCRATVTWSVTVVDIVMGWVVFLTFSFYKRFLSRKIILFILIYNFYNCKYILGNNLRKMMCKVIFINKIDSLTCDNLVLVLKFLCELNVKFKYFIKY